MSISAEVYIRGLSMEEVIVPAMPQIGNRLRLNISSRNIGVQIIQVTGVLVDAVSGKIQIAGEF